MDDIPTTKLRPEQVDVARRRSHGRLAWIALALIAGALAAGVCVAVLSGWPGL